MGVILSEKQLPNSSIKISIKVEESELLSLMGCVNKVNIFSTDLCTTKSFILEKGQEGVTKYFFVPRVLRIHKSRKVKEIKAQAIEMQDKTIFIYTVDHSDPIF